MSDAVDEPVNAQQATENTELLDMDPSLLIDKDEIRAWIRSYKSNGDVIEVPGYIFCRLFQLLEADCWTVPGGIVMLRCIDKIFHVWNKKFDRQEAEFEFWRLPEAVLSAFEGVTESPKHALFDKIAHTVASMFQEYELDDFKAVYHVEEGMTRFRALVQRDVDDYRKNPRDADEAHSFELLAAEQELAHGMPQPSSERPLPSLTNLRKLMGFAPIDFGTTAYSTAFNQSSADPSTAGPTAQANAFPLAPTSTARRRRGNRTNHTAQPYTSEEKLAILLEYRDFPGETAAVKAAKINANFPNLPNRTADGIRQQYNLLSRNGPTITELKRQLGIKDSEESEEEQEASGEVQQAGEAAPGEKQNNPDDQIAATAGLSGTEVLQDAADSDVDMEEEFGSGGGGDGAQKEDQGEAERQ